MTSPSVSDTRCIAFLLTRNPKTSAFQRARKHLVGLANWFGHTLVELSHNNNRLLLCHTGLIDDLVLQSADSLNFCVGPIVGQWGSAHTQRKAITDPGAIRDRFLHVEVGAEFVAVTTDYAGTVPCFYSSRGGLSLSNVEPVVVLDSGSTLDDIDVSSMYAFLRYFHLIWDRTLFRHIRLQEPDSRFVWKTEQTEPSRLTLRSVMPSDGRQNLTDRQVASELFDLNQRLVLSSLDFADESLLPLSSGYDSRMILAALSTSKALRDRLKAFTYGPLGSIEVKAARELCKRSGITWQWINLPCRFLSREYLERIGAIFGSSLHFHGMYQLEFGEILKNIRPSAVLTSGFMTGVPAGQHVSALGIRSDSALLTDAMNSFAQSQYWTDDDLLDISARFDRSMLFEAEEDFRRAFNRMAGTPTHRSIMFDVWTRQRNFIAYHPRTTEWQIPFISPHMCPEYANFFLSLSERHLTDRLAVELMLKYHYPESAKVPTNSNGLHAISGFYSMFAPDSLATRAIRRLSRTVGVPGWFVDVPIEFDSTAIRHSGREGVWPIWSVGNVGRKFLCEFFPESVLEELVASAENGSERDYNRLLPIQSIAYAVKLVTGEG